MACKSLVIFGDFIFNRDVEALKNESLSLDSEISWCHTGENIE